MRGFNRESSSFRIHIGISWPKVYVRITVLWDMTLCSSLICTHVSKEPPAYNNYGQISRKFLRNVRTYLPKHMVSNPGSYPQNQQTWKPEIFIWSWRVSIHFVLEGAKGQKRPTREMVTTNRYPITPDCPLFFVLCFLGRYTTEAVNKDLISNIEE